MRAFVKWVDWINKVLDGLLGLALAVMTLVVFYQVLVRFLFTAFDVYTSAPWTEELARYLMIWIVFIGGAVATRYARLLAVDALIFAIPQAPGKIIKVVAHIVSLSFYACVFVIGLEWARQGLTERAPVMRISMFYLYVSMSISGVLMMVNTITLLIDTVINNKDIREPEVEKS
ncbi:TRAP transporter small permease [Alkalihalobacillus oceani]|uniref:TRAP transporter small permease n=1 Tax=Halalkalibacter oceani TaxID=1653776 RepID=UPI00203B417F|nr:TRAP transporter small permease [Halalkalibacter oceani]MCM3760439.1 TRAP transporter small permease [Halalkalibacter oceani]